MVFFARGPGIYSSLPASGGPPEGVAAILVFALFGAFCGLMAGLVLLPVIRYVSFLMGRNCRGGGWAILGAMLGAISFALWAATGRE